MMMPFVQSLVTNSIGRATRAVPFWMDSVLSCVWDQRKHWINAVFQDGPINANYSHTTRDAGVVYANLRMVYCILFCHQDKFIFTPKQQLIFHITSHWLDQPRHHSLMECKFIY